VKQELGGLQIPGPLAQGISGPGICSSASGTVACTGTFGPVSADPQAVDWMRKARLVPCEPGFIFGAPGDMPRLTRFWPTRLRWSRSSSCSRSEAAVQCSRSLAQRANAPPVPAAAASEHRRRAGVRRNHWPRPEAENRTPTPASSARDGRCQVHNPYGRWRGRRRVSSQLPPRAVGRAPLD
jgi:hypothetical protein